MYLVDYLHTYFILIFHLENNVRFSDVYLFIK